MLIFKCAPAYSGTNFVVVSDERVQTEENPTAGDEEAQTKKRGGGGIFTASATRIWNYAREV